MIQHLYSIKQGNQSLWEYETHSQFWWRTQLYMMTVPRCCSSGWGTRVSVSWCTPPPSCPRRTGPSAPGRDTAADIPPRSLQDHTHRAEQRFRSQASVYCQPFFCDWFSDFLFRMQIITISELTLHFSWENTLKWELWHTSFKYT